MNILGTNILISLLLFFVIWVSSSAIINGITKISLKAKLHPFLISFVLLGLLTSSTEISLAINSHINHVVPVSIGNLLGGIIVLFLLVIPSLAILGNGISLENNFNKFELLVTLILITLPSLFFIDGKFALTESVVLMIAYVIPIVLLVYRDKDIPKKRGRIPNNIKNTSVLTELFKVILGGLVLLFASDRLIDLVVSSAQVLNISPFIISLLTLSIGTNLPEFVIVIRSILMGEKGIALGNYLGSALVNLLVLGILTFLNPSLEISNGFVKIALFTILGVTLFYIFVNTRKQLSRQEGLILLSIYILFLLSEIIFM